MVEMPQRSVTRFFIPLIDVLTLLFCVFLVTPLAQPASEEGKPLPEGGQLTHEELVQQNQEDRQRLRALETQLEQLRDRLKDPIGERIALRVLEIDPDTGRLYYRDRQNPTADRIEIRNAADALALIEHDRMRLGVEQRELVYVVLYPRDRSSDRPTVRQREQYESWFRGVQVRFDRPGDAP